jgi:hypothetical protein
VPLSHVVFRLGRAMLFEELSVVILIAYMKLHLRIKVGANGMLLPLEFFKLYEECN